MRLNPSFGLFGLISLLVLTRICCESDISRRKKIDSLLRIKDKETIPTELKDVQNVWVQNKEVIRKQNLEVQQATKKPPKSKESGGSRTILIIVVVAVCVLCIGNIIVCIVMYDRGKKSKTLGKGSISKTSSRRSLDRIEQNVSQNRSTYSKLYSKSRDQLRTEAEVISLMKKATDPAVNDWVNRYLSKPPKSDVLSLTAQRKSKPRSTASIRTVRRSSRSLSKTSGLTKYPDLPLSKYPSLLSKKYNASLTKTSAPSASSTEIESNTSVVSEHVLSEYTRESESSPTRTLSRSLRRKSVKRGGGKPASGKSDKLNKQAYKSPTRRTPKEQGKSSTLMPTLETDPGSMPIKTGISLTQKLGPSGYFKDIPESDALATRNSLSEYFKEISQSDISVSRMQIPSKDKQLKKTPRNSTNMHDPPTAKTPTKQGKPKPKKSRNGKDTSSSAPLPHPVPTKTNSHSQPQDYLSSVPSPIPPFHAKNVQLQDDPSSIPPPPPLPPFHAKNVQPQDYPSSIPPPPVIPLSIPPPPPIPSSIPPPPPIPPFHAKNVQPQDYPSSIPPPPPVPSSIPPPPPIPPHSNTRNAHLQGNSSDFLYSIKAGVKLKEVKELGLESNSKDPMDFIQSIKAGIKLKPVTEPGPETITDGRSDFLKSIQAGVKLKPVVVSESTSKGSFDICQSIKAGHTLKPVADRPLKSKPMDHGTLLSQAVLKPNLTSVKERKFQQPRVEEETFSDILKKVKLRRALLIKRRPEEVSEASQTQIPFGNTPQPPDLQLELNETLINKYPTTVTKNFDKDYEWKNKVRHKKKEKTPTYPPGDEVSIEEVRQRPKKSPQMLESVAKKTQKKNHVKASRKNKNTSKK